MLPLSVPRHLSVKVLRVLNLGLEDVEKALSDGERQVATYYKPKRSKGERERRTWVARAQRELAVLPVSDRIHGATPHFYLYAT